MRSACRSPKERGAMVHRLAIAFLFAVSAAAADEPPQDPAVALARILAGKGTISAAELSSVEATSAGDRVGALAAILQRKGLLNEAEVARLREPRAPQPVVAAKAPST